MKTLLFYAMIYTSCCKGNTVSAFINIFAYYCSILWKYESIYLSLFYKVGT